jgi:hypothetical protein
LNIFQPISLLLLLLDRAIILVFVIGIVRVTILTGIFGRRRRLTVMHGVAARRLLSCSSILNFSSSASECSSSYPSLGFVRFDAVTAAHADYKRINSV